MQQNRSSGGFHPHFSTWLASSDQLERTLVGHHDILRDFLAGLRAIEQGSAANHFLLVGPRGIGKTHVICLGGHYVTGRAQKPKDWTGPSNAWVCVLFTEEEYAGQNSLANFLLTLFTKLHEALPLEDLWHLPKTLHHGTDQPVIDCCFERLEKFHREKGKKILVLIDNLQKVLQQWSEDDHQKLRSFLSRNNLLVIFGSAPSVFREVIDQKAVFHDFFEVRILAELSNEQVLDLLSRRFQEDGRQAEYDARKQELAKKIPAISVLTGGNPRLVLFLYEIATRSTFLDIELALRNLIEELREYFVRRFDELPDQARKVLDTIAQMAGPATPKEIAHEARLGLALVNSQLKRLKEGHYVRPIKFQRQKSTRYDITERLFRIWRQTATVAGRQRFRFLADFLKIYFTTEEMRGLYSQHLEFLHNASELPREEVIRHIEELYYFQAAGEGEIRYGAFSNRVEGLAKLGELRWAEEEAQYFAAESSRNEDKLGITSAYKLQAMIHTELGRYSDATSDVEKLVDAGAYQDAAAAAQKLIALNPASSDTWRYWGVATGSLGDHAKALDAFTKAAEVGQPTSELWSFQAMALTNLKRIDEALKCWEQAAALDDKNAMAWQQLGMAVGNAGDHERALATFRKAAEVGQPTSELWSFQAMALTNLKRTDEALKCWEQAVALDDRNATAWGELGVLVHNAGNYERALGAFRKAAEVGKPTSELWSFQGKALMGLKRVDEAIGCAEKAVALDDRNATAWGELGVLVHNAGNYERALGAFRKAAEVGKPTSELWSFQGKALMGLKRVDEAIGCAEKAVALDDRNATAWEELGVLVYNAGNYERALGAFRKAAEVGKPTSELWSFQGKALKGLKRVDEALGCAEKAVALDDRNATAWEELGVLVYNAGNYERALGAFRKAAEVGKPTSELWSFQGKALMGLKRVDEALGCAEKAVALDDRNTAAWRELGIAYFLSKKHEDALTAFRKAALAGQPTAELWTLQAVTLQALARSEEALSCAEQAVSSDPSQPIAWRVLGYAAQDLGRLEQALVAFRKAVETGEPSAELRHSEARVLRELGRPQESLAVLDQALASQAENPDLWRSRAWTLLELDKVEDALESFGQAREKGATPRQYHHDRGDLLLLSGRYAEALKDLEEGLKAEPDDWDLQTDRLLSLACLGQQGPLMEALPDALSRVQVPPASASSVCDYLHDVALNALRRGENPICLGLLRTSLELKPWTSSDWFGKQLGNFLRRALDTQPHLFIELVQLVHDRFKDEKVSRLLEPFLKASEFLQTKNVAVLERLFPEVRELVLDIVKRIDPALHEKSRRMI